jgi:hypothetical protein
VSRRRTVSIEGDVSSHFSRSLFTSEMSWSRLVAIHSARSREGGCTAVRESRMRRGCRRLGTVEGPIARARGFAR